MRKLNLSKLRNASPPTMRFSQRNHRKTRVKGSQKARWAGSVAEESNKGQRLRQPAWLSDPGSAALHSTHRPQLTSDETKKPPPQLQPFTRLPCVLKGWRHRCLNHEVSLSFCCTALWWMLQVQIGAHPLCRLLPTRSSLDRVILDIFTAFKHPPLPPSCSARGLIWCRCTFSLSQAVQTGFFYLFI